MTVIFEIYLGMDKAVIRQKSPLAANWWRLRRDKQSDAGKQVVQWTPTASLTPVFEQLPNVTTEKRRIVEIVLSDAFCKYDAAPRPMGLRSRSELIASLRSKFESTYVDPSTPAWSLAYHTPLLSQIDLVVGVQTALLDSLRQASNITNCTLVSVKPHWMQWYKQCHKRLRSGTHWVISSDENAATIAYFERGQCIFLRSSATSKGRAMPKLSDLLSRHQAFLASPDEKASVWFGGHGMDTKNGMENWRGTFQNFQMDAY